MENFIIIAIIFFAFTINANAQEKKAKPKPIKISGSIKISYENYTFSAKNYSTFRPRYPLHLLRFDGNLNIAIGNNFNLPFGVNMTNQKKLYNFPTLPNDNVIDFVQSPQNNISISPKYKWCKVALGTHVPNYSNLSTGDNNIFGAGVELTPGKFIFSANYGISQRAIEADPLIGFDGVYSQKLMSARIGFGKLDKSKFLINAAYVKDDTLSVLSPLNNAKPIEGAVVSNLIEILVFKKVVFKTETAGSVYTSNKRGNFTNNSEAGKVIDNVIRLNEFSKIDAANSTSIDYNGKKFGLGGEIRYIGPVFVPIGYRNIEQDVLDYKVKSNIKLFKSKTILNGQFGIRTNNIKKTKVYRSQRIIGSFNFTSQISKILSLTGNFANFGFVTDNLNPLLRTEITNNSFSLSPVLLFKRKKHSHIYNLNASYNQFIQFDQSTATNKTNSTLTGMFNYNLQFKDIPLTTGLNALFLKTTVANNDFTMQNYGLNIGYVFWKKKLNTILQFNYAIIERAGFTADNRIGISLKNKLRLNKRLTLHLNYNGLNNFFGSVRPGASTLENRISVSIEQRF